MLRFVEYGDQIKSDKFHQKSPAFFKAKSPEKLEEKNPQKFSGERAKLCSFTVGHKTYIKRMWFRAENVP